MRTLIENALMVSDGQRRRGSLLIEDEFISDIIGESQPLPTAHKHVEAGGGLLLPGVVDVHVHFREPGLTRKGDFASESSAAVAGGVTSVVDMPNVTPPTTTLPLLEERALMAAEHSHVNYTFLLGATRDNLCEIAAADARVVPGVKLFTGSTTGGMLVDDETTIRSLMRATTLPIVAHAEDQRMIDSRTRQAREQWGEDPVVSLHSWIRGGEVCLRASTTLAHIAREEGARLHIAHLSTARELPLLGGTVTGEACVGYLLFADEDYARLGSLVKVNPALKTPADREALLRAVGDGTINIIATDHAPHLPEEKMGGAFTAASGMPLVQFSLVAMLELVDEGRLTLERLTEVMCHAPAALYGMEGRGHIQPGMKADLALVERGEWVLERGDILSKCGWSPLEGRGFRHRVAQTYVNGCLAYDHGRVTPSQRGQRLRFRRAS